MATLWQRPLLAIERLGVSSDTDVDAELQRTLLVTAGVLYSIAGVIWGSVYMLLGEIAAGMIPWMYTGFTIANLAFFAWSRNRRWFRFSQLFVTLLLPAALQLALGGFVASSAVIIWSFAAPLGALMVGPTETAWRWFVAFAGLLVVAPVFQSSIREGNGLSELTRTVFFVANVGAVTAIVFLLMRYFSDLKTRAYRLLDAEQSKSQRLLLNVLPEPIAARLREGPTVIADDHASVTVLFADVVGFTQLSERLSPAEMVELLNDVFSYFDRLVEERGAEKIRTVGDNYMVVAGAPDDRPDHAVLVTELALDMLEFRAHCAHPEVSSLEFRIGINSGPAVAGVIGTTKFHYDVWGDAVNVASRMESHGVPGRVQVGPGTRELIGDRFVLSSRGSIDVKGKGTMQTWLVEGRQVARLGA